MAAWLDQLFSAKVTTKEGGIVRRKKKSVRKHASLRELADEVKERDWHLIETQDQYVVICRSGAVKIHC